VLRHKRSGSNAMRCVKLIVAAVVVFIVSVPQAYAKCVCDYCDSMVSSRIGSLKKSVIARLESNARDFNTGTTAIVETMTEMKKTSTEAIVNTLWEIYRRSAESKILQKKVDTYGDVASSVSVVLCGAAPRSATSLSRSDSGDEIKTDRYRATTKETDFLPSTVIGARKVQATTIFSPDSS